MPSLYVISVYGFLTGFTHEYRQRALYFDDGGETVRKYLKDGGEDMLPLTEWVISPPHTKNLSATEAWEVRPYLSRKVSLGSRVE